MGRSRICGRRVEDNAIANRHPRTGLPRCAASCGTQRAKKGQRREPVMLVGGVKTEARMCRAPPPQRQAALLRLRFRSTEARECYLALGPIPAEQPALRLCRYSQVGVAVFARVPAEATLTVGRPLERGFKIGGAGDHADHRQRHSVAKDEDDQTRRSRRAPRGCRARAAAG